MSDDHSVFDAEVNAFVDWCDSHHLDLNVSKTKEMVIDYRRKNKTDAPPCVIKGQTVERVGVYKYLGTIVDDKLSFHENTQAIHTKCRQRLNILFQLRSFMVSSKILQRCYNAYIQSVLTFSIVCWFGSVTGKERMKLNGIVSLCEKVIGIKLDRLATVYNDRT